MDEEDSRGEEPYVQRGLDPVQEDPGASSEEDADRIEQARTSRLRDRRRARGGRRADRHRVKALRAGRASLIDAYVAIDRGEAWLEAAHISEYAQGTWTNHAPRRKRKLLLHRTEIDRLDQRTREKGFTIVPLSLYFLDGRVKVEIAVARGKQEWDKRQTLRERQDNLEARRSMRYRELG